MTNRQEAYRKKQQLRQKQAGFLALLFVGVLWFQFGRSSKPELATLKKPKPTQIASPVKAGPQTMTSPIAEPSPPVELPRFDIEKIASANPFNHSDQLPTPTVAAPSQTTVLPSNPVAIYKTSEGWTAIIDRQIVRQGDLLPTGHRVVSVNRDGVQLQADVNWPRRSAHRDEPSDYTTKDTTSDCALKHVGDIACAPFASDCGQHACRFESFGC